MWEIVADFKKKFMRIQDLKIRFDALSNVKVYITSYFRSDKESNIIFPDQITLGENINFEMYNTTFVYMIPQNRD